MTNALLKRNFKKGQHVYVVEDTSDFAAIAEILKVNEKEQTLLLILCGDTYKTYSFEEYGKSIFDTPKAANDRLTEISS